MQIIRLIHSGLLNEKDKDNEKLVSQAKENFEQKYGISADLKGIFLILNIFFK